MSTREKIGPLYRRFREYTTDFAEALEIEGDKYCARKLRRRLRELDQRSFGEFYRGLSPHQQDELVDIVSETYAEAVARSVEETEEFLREFLHGDTGLGGRKAPHRHLPAHSQ